MRNSAFSATITFFAYALIGHFGVMPECPAAGAQEKAEESQPAKVIPAENKSKTTIFPGGGFRLESQKLDKETAGKTDFVGAGVKVQMNLSGSMCIACLSDFKRKLAELPGVASVKIEYPGDFSNFGQSYALLSLTLDEGQIAVPELRVFIQEQGYQPYKIIRKGYK